METNAIALFLSNNMYYPVVLIFVVILIQRRFGEQGVAKRNAIMYIGIMLLALWGFSFFLLRFELADALLIPFVLGCLTLAVFKRKLMLPFRRACSQCGRKLPIKQVLFLDSTLCESCAGRGQGS